MATESEYSQSLRDVFFFYNTGTKTPLILFNLNTGLSFEFLQQAMDTGFKKNKTLTEKNCSTVRINLEPYKNGKIDSEELMKFKSFLTSQITSAGKNRGIVVLENFEALPQHYQNICLSVVDVPLNEKPAYFLVFSSRISHMNTFPSILKNKANVILANEYEPYILKSSHSVEKSILDSMEVTLPPVLKLSLKDQQRLVFHYLINHPKGINDNQPAEVSMYTEVGGTRHVNKQLFFGLSDTLMQVINDYQNGENNVDLQVVQDAILKDNNPWRNNFSFSYMINKGHSPFCDIQDEVAYAVKQSLIKKEPFADNLKEVINYLSNHNIKALKKAFLMKEIDTKIISDLTILTTKLN